VAIAAVLLLSACGSAASTPDPEPTDAGEDDVADRADSSDAQGPDSRADTPEACAAGTIVTTLVGSVVDELGAPLEGVRPQPCVRLERGDLVCLRPATTTADGRFAQAVPFESQCMTALTFRVSLPGARRTTPYCPEPLPERSAVLNRAEPLVLHPTEPPELLPPEGDPAAVRTVRFVGGFELDVAPRDLFFTVGGWDDLSMAVVPPGDDGLCFLGDGPRPAALYAFSPEGDVTDSAATMRIPNTAALAPAAVVDLFVLGALDCTLADGTALEEGRWQRFGGGVVSADGAFITPDAGLPCLTWLGVQEVAR